MFTLPRARRRSAFVVALAAAAAALGLTAAYAASTPGWSMGPRRRAWLRGAWATAPPRMYNAVVYAGTASTEENGVDCEASVNACYFRGSASAVDLATGAIIWKTYTISPAQSAAGFSGAAV